ncbi:hypothetical protein [Roseibium salinum]|uniref:Tail assembly chaperone n=1 Tax=Roseibium salinum TaxID=1604349 RepID=A0ABT3QYC7_9HYPH|nr:hypothetical protein [Roseibium sp. DSM 29163]MCX2721846.1 hypothetical protein [Roseibium sp. DSM 29163]MDN3720107.1 hypothetical protein [Roseibium salinum]
METGFFHPDRGYWQTVSQPSAAIRMSYPAGTVEVPIKPGANYEWIDGTWIYTPPPPPTLKELREAMPPVTARQFRLGLINASRALEAVDAAIAAISDETERARALVEWEYATQFSRLAPFVVSLAPSIGFTEDEFDTLWQEAMKL